jgi:beta-N-acetylhexosaminidase
MGAEMNAEPRRRPDARRTAVALVVAVAAVTMAGPATAWARTSAPDTGTQVRGSAPRAAGCTNAGRLHHWRVHRLAEQTVIVPVEETHVGAASSEVAAGAGGVILFGSRAPSDLGSRLAHLMSLAPAGLAPVVMTDEEGGSVQRMPNLVGSVPSARDMGRHWTAARIQSVARHVAVRMAHAHVTMDLAPVLDLDGRSGPNASDAIGTRSFSPHRKIATRDGLAFAHGLQAGGVVPVVKHFPGIGAADGNTDLRQASTPPWSDVRTHDLRPFRSAVRAGLPAVMVSNARVPGLTKLPASLSRAAVHGVLRHDLGFRGLVLPDSLTAGAVTGAGFGLPRAAVRALSVGDDMVLFGASPDRLRTTTENVVNAVVSAVHAGTLPRSRLESAVGHVLRAKRVDLCA